MTISPEQPEFHFSNNILLFNNLLTAPSKVIFERLPAFLSKESCGGLDFKNFKLFEELAANS